MIQLIIYTKKKHTTSTSYNSSHFEMSWNVPISPHKNHRTVVRFPPEISGGYLPGMAQWRGFQIGRQSELGHDPRWKCVRCHAMNFCLCLHLCVCVYGENVYIIIYYMYIDIGFEINLVKVCVGCFLVHILRYCMAGETKLHWQQHHKVQSMESHVLEVVLVMLQACLQFMAVQFYPVPITSDLGWFNQCFKPIPSGNLT